MEQEHALVARLDHQLAEEGSLAGRIRLVVGALWGGIAFSTSLGLEDQALLHAIADVDQERRITIFTLDTGRLFPETIELIDANQNRFDRTIKVYAPQANAVEDLVARDGPLGFRLSVAARKACCNVRKVGPLRRALMGSSGWITGLRRDQSVGRGAVPFAEWDASHGLIKLNPIADWSLAGLKAYVAEHAIPINALHARGYPSIGCQPCTRAVAPGEDIRAGRWWWENADGKECGLHNSPARRAAARNTTIPEPVE